MDDNKKPEPQATAAQPELTPADLEKVAGGGTGGSSAGKPDVSELSVTKVLDKSSPVLY